jgi:tyrosyl-tRNA synthetase
MEIEQILTRGVAQVLPDKKSLVALMKQRPVRLYLGIDPTGVMLHLGHSVVLRKLQQFAAAGQEVILLIGNGTVKIGDPSGRDASRPVLTDEEIESNFKTWKKQASKVLDFSLVKIKHNGDWLDKLDYPAIVKLMAKTTVQQLLERDMFQERLKNKLPIFGHEIMYPLVQGYDSVAMDVDLEIGGSDQTFNMLMGRNLQKVYNGREKWVLSVPLINGSDGRKMSKSYGNFIPLLESAEGMYAKIMTVIDELIGEYFTLLTDVSDQEIAEMMAAMAAGANPMEFKKRLAKTLVTMYHSERLAAKAATVWQKTVSEKQLPKNMPLVTVPSLQLDLIELANLAKPAESKTNLRRLRDQGGLELLENNVLRLGKHSYYQLKEAS